MLAVKMGKARLGKADAVCGTALLLAEMDSWCACERRCKQQVHLHPVHEEPKGPHDLPTHSASSESTMTNSCR